MNQFINCILRLLDGERCRHCHEPLSCHAIVGEWCWEGHWFSKTQKYEKEMYVKTTAA